MGEIAKAGEGRKRLHRALRVTVHYSHYNREQLNYLNLGVKCSLHFYERFLEYRECGNLWGTEISLVEEEVGWKGRYHRHLRFLKEP